MLVIPVAVDVLSISAAGAMLYAEDVAYMFVSVTVLSVILAAVAGAIKRRDNSMIKAVIFIMRILNNWPLVLIM